MLPAASGAASEPTLVSRTGAALDTARAQVLSNLKHDIRQPMQLIGMAARGLKELLHRPQELALVGAIEKATADLTELIQSMLDLMTLDFEHPLPSLQPVLLDGVFEDIRASHEIAAQKRGIRLAVMPSRLVVQSDRRSLTRVIGNLVGNAIVHSGGTRIVIGARRRDGHYSIEVHDNGRGIAPAEQAQIFELGWRGAAAADAAAPQVAEDSMLSLGSGLGLYIVREFAERLGGTVAVRSIPGRRTAFKVVLPGPVERSTPRPRLARSEGLPLSGRWVAIIDDQRAALDAMRVLFESMGATVVAADDELRFITEVLQLPRVPDLFLLDFRIGHSYADRCLGIFERRFGRDNVRAIIVTGQPSHPRLKELRGIPVIEKPISNPAFQRMVEVLTGQRPWDPREFG